MFSFLIWKITPHLGICDGDGGNPLVVEGEFNGNDLCLVGIATVHPSNCDDPRFPSVFIRAPLFNFWIKENIMRLTRLSFMSKTYVQAKHL